MLELNAFVEQINGIFKKEANRYRAHELCRPLLLEMAKDRSILFQIIKKNLNRPGILEQMRINPVIALEIESNEVVSFVAHCWMPLPDKKNSVSHQSIHHHGKLLLTSVAAFGEGYESIIFKKGFSIDTTSGNASMQIDKMYKNPYLNVEFIDVNTPHIVFYPSEFSVTYALWTNAEAGTSENIKKIGFVKKYKKQLRKLIDYVGLASLLGLNTNEYLDFYPENGKIKALKSRITYPVGSNRSFLNGFFHLLQMVNYPDVDSVKSAVSAVAGQNKQALNKLAEQFESGKPIADEFEKIHLNIEHINIEKQLVMQCFA